MNAVLALLPLLINNGPPICVTKCGLVSEDFRCEELQATETATLEALARFANMPVARSCPALAGWTVHLNQKAPNDLCPGQSWAIIEDLCVVGFTHFEVNALEVARSATLQSGALPHEIVHVLDLAHGRPRGHCFWTERGVKRALKEITGEVDNTAERCL